MARVGSPVVEAWTTFDTALGACGLAWSDAGVTWLQLPEADDDATIARMLAKRPAAADAVSARAAPPWVRDAVARVKEHLAGRPQDLSKVPLDLAGASAFTVRVFRALQAVPPGTTVTYGDLARAAGSPGASRAVGRAMAKNPFPLLVPCHRVVGSGGDADPGGFSAYGGVTTKQKILAREGGSLAKQRSLFDVARGRALPFDGGAAVRHLASADAVLGRHISAVGALRLELESTESTFGALAQSIVYQQLSGKAAATILGRVRALYSESERGSERQVRLDPARLLATPEPHLRAAGLSANKLASLRDLAARTVAGEIPTLPELEKLPDDTIVERLTHVRGVGRWTVEMLLIFRLGRPDVLPVDDYGIKKGFARVFPRVKTTGKDALPAPADMLRRAEKWRPFRSVASWYLWRALDQKNG